MLISTCGFGNTGASAVLNFLDGYNDLQKVSGFEFQLFHAPDGINDLKYHLTLNRERIASNVAIKRFRIMAFDSFLAKNLKKKIGPEYVDITKQYIEDLIQIRWKGTSAYDTSDVSNVSNVRPIRYLQKIANYIAHRISPDLRYPPFKERFFSIMEPEDFDRITGEYFNRLLHVIGVDPEKDILMDVLFSATNPQMGTEFVNDPRIIIVYRDPRDLFIRDTEHRNTNGHTPCTDVKDFVKYYKTLMERSIVYEAALQIQYEDLIYNYYPTTQKIMDFLGYTKRPENEFAYFNPDESVKYTKAWNTYPGHEEEVAYIEENLAEYIRNYDDYICVDIQKKNWDERNEL